MVVRWSLTHRPRSASQKVFPLSGTHFYQKLIKPQGLVRLEILGKSRKLFRLIGSETYLPAFNIVSQPLRYRSSLSMNGIRIIRIRQLR
jgi:hypothetical protein